MNPAAPSEPRRSRPWKGAVVRLLVFVAFAFCVGLGVRALGRQLERDARPAGFGRGLIQGALMPMALPTLLVGVDVMIYAERNTGVPYKLGYTMGVTACGAVFFGAAFARVTRWRKGGGGGG